MMQPWSSWPYRRSDPPLEGPLEPLDPDIVAPVVGGLPEPERMKVLLDRWSRVREVVNPFVNYEVPLGDGPIFAVAGADLIAIAEAMVNIHDVIERKESSKVLVAAFLRLKLIMEGKDPAEPPAEV
jgi:hypothetical protein